MTNVRERKLKALREAAQVGVEALERGQFREFDNFDDLRVYLDDLAANAIAGTAK
jgi:antitoxin ParD1/3/4